MAKSNDYWLHAVGTTGSHVIIPAREVKGSPPADLIKRAAILAIYYSKLRGDMAGEVYISRRQHIKKRSGMAPGLWQIVQAETAYYRYDERELQETLNLAR
jgi:predicted ribosome quality control (RQC) complex YloA/Tae2 family protein